MLLHTIKECTLPKSTTRVTMGFSDENELLDAIDELEREALTDAQQAERTRFDRASAEAAKARDKAEKAWDRAAFAHYKALPIADKAFDRAAWAEAKALYAEVEADKAKVRWLHGTNYRDRFAECGLPSHRAKLALEIDDGLKLADEMVGKIGKIYAAHELRDEIHKTYEELDNELDAIDWLID